MKNFFKSIFIIFLITSLFSQKAFTDETKKLLSTDWSFKGFFGKFEKDIGRSL